MGYIYSTTVANGDLGNINIMVRYDLTPIRIDIDSTADVVFVTAIKNALREAECSSVGIEFLPVCDAAGLVTLLESGSATQKTFLTLTLERGASLNSLRDTGIVTFVGGNIVSADGSPIVEENPELTYMVFFSQAGIVSQVSTGSGLSTDEHNTIYSMKDVVDQLAATTATVQQLKKLILERHNTVVNGGITQFVAGSGDVATTVAVTYDANGIPTAEVPQ